ncbi:ABC transporter substrate-binding protein [Paracoccus suum]|uniref:ABC transporter substrate-binding protein n=1 Tax=Paracoccus suum TaxID=2259340 RepID=A0A344PKR7_9RHOB|nr:ABC transporter substrate-binding protein [Paracoccus suum]AXC49972.1 ABC transporter substrate-binding protein [Paracoccus suum]
MKRHIPTLAALMLAASTLAVSAAELRIGLESDPDALDPAKSRTFVGRIVFTAMCNKLIDVNEKLEFVPQLSTAWNLSEDGLTLSFTLREGVKFHDGTPFDAEAVKANIERAKTLEDSVRKSELASVESVEVVSPTEVRMHLTGPDATLLAQLSDRAGMMLSPTAFANGADVGANPVCSGPFKFVSRVSQDKIVLEKFADYWNADAIKLDRVVFLPIPDSTVRLANLQSGDLDMVNQLAATDMAAVSASGNLRVEQVVGLGYQGITFNTANGPRADNPAGKDARVREALNLSIDRQALSQVVFSGAMPPAGQPFPPDSIYHDPAFPPPARDVEKAKALLAEAGVKTPVRIDVQTPNTPVQMQMMQVVQSMAAEAGFDIQITAKEFATLIADAGKGDFEASQQGWSGRVDPDGNIHQFVTTDAGFNDGKYSNPDVDRLLNEARKVSDVETRKGLYNEAQQILSRDLPLIYLYYLPWLYGVDQGVQGFKPYPDGMIRLENVTDAD